MKNFQFSKEFKIQNSKFDEGFTIIEIIIAIFIFSVIAVEVSAIFVQILKLERRLFAVQKVQENSLIVLESMAKEIRIGSIQNQEAPNCDLASLAINHPINGSITYRLSNGVVQRIVNDVTTEASSPEVEFSRLSFCVSGSGLTDQKPSRITIIASVRNRSDNENETNYFNLQTTVISRAQDEY